MGHLFPKERVQLRPRIALQQALAHGLKLSDFHVSITQNLSHQNVEPLNPKKDRCTKKKEEHIT